MKRTPEEPFDETHRSVDETARYISQLEQRVESLEDGLDRTASWRKTSLLAVVIVALLAILMLGIVAVKAVDESPADDAAQGDSGGDTGIVSVPNPLVAPVIELQADPRAGCNPGGPMSAMIACPLEEAAALDERINAVASRVFDSFPTDEGRAHFVEGEAAWLMYRMEYCRSQGDVYEGGTLADLVAAECLVEVTQEHLDDLEQFLDRLTPQ